MNRRSEKHDTRRRRVALPNYVWQELESEAQACGRTALQQLAMILTIYFSEELIRPTRLRLVYSNLERRKTVMECKRCGAESGDCDLCSECLAIIYEDDCDEMFEDDSDE